MRGSKRLLVFILYLNAIHISNGNNAICGCYILGTMPSIEGESMCDNKTMQCKCFPNVIGKNCDKCAEGFSDIMSGRGCTSCRCDLLGSKENSCDAITGQCLCKEGFVGWRCDQCVQSMYKLSPEKCTECNCNPHGSKNSQCNATGQCSCLPNVEGTHCNQCKENTHSINRGCIPCPPCYKFVKREIKNFTKYLTTIEQALDDIENNLPLHIQDHKHFLNELRLLKAKINKLRLQYDESTKSEVLEEALDDLSKQAEDLHNEITGLIQKFNDEFNYKEITDALYSGQQDLKEAKALAVTCEEALQNATKMSNNLNRHNKTMTRIAKDALATTQKIEAEAEAYYQLSLHVNSTCNEACSTAELFHGDQQAHQDEIKGFRSQLLNSSSGVQTMKTFLIGFRQEVENSKNEAARLEKEASELYVPVTDDMAKDLSKIEEDGEVIDAKMQDLHETSNEIQSKINSTEELLERVETAQKKIDSQFVLVQEYDARADVAINMTNDILITAQESLERLKEYEKIKQSAEDALKEMPEIRAKVDAVLNNSDEIYNIFKELSRTIKDMETIKLKIDLLLKLMENNKLAFLKNEKELEELEEQQKQITKELEEHHQQLKKARNDLKRFREFQTDLERSIRGLEEYTLFLDTLPLTDHQLLEVEKEIERMEEMQNAVEYLEKEKARLQMEVENVRDVLEGIPYNNSTLCEAAKSEPKTI